METQNFQIVTDFTNQTNKDKFFQFVDEVFPGCDFREWSERGFWTESYKPFSIIEDGNIISNVSIQMMNMIINGEKKRGIQFSAVGTVKSHRRRGLSRYLMEHVLEKYCKQTEIMFLFANDSVLNFYPKFGFKRKQQYIFNKKCDINIKDGKNLEKLNIEEEDNYNFLLEKLKNRTLLTKTFGAENYYSISMWHIFNFYKNNLYFLEDENALIIAELKNGKVKIIEIISHNAFDINKIDGYFEGEIDEVIYCFPPDQYYFDYDDREIYEDSPLFILENCNFESDNIKFPETAVT